MRTRFESCLSICFAAIFVSAVCLAAKTDETAIRKTIGVYIEGAIKGDGELMAKAFSKDAYVYGFIDAESYNGPATNLFAWTSGNIPAKDLKYKIARIDIEGTIAMVRLEIDNWNERERSKPDAKEKLRKYTEMLSLLKSNNEWKIASKTFHTHK